MSQRFFVAQIIINLTSNFFVLCSSFLFFVFPGTAIFRSPQEPTFDLTRPD